MNNKGFIMPTVLAFIIITSSALLYQSISVVSQVYSLKAEVRDLTKLEYAINTKRIIDGLVSMPTCKYTRQLDYISENSSLQIDSNCIFTETEDEAYNQVVSKLITSKSLNQTDYQKLKNIAITSKSQVDEQGHEMELGQFSDKYTILFVEYELVEPQNRILLIDMKGNIVRNTSVN